MGKAKQLTFAKVNGWGGKRRGAGRPSHSNQVSHAARDQVTARHPVHITMRLRPVKANLRTPPLHAAFKTAAKACRKFGLEINHYALLGNHLHLIAEAPDNVALARGMRSLAFRLGRAVRQIAGSEGPVFNGRYHLHVLKTPAEYKRALRYVLLNFARHERLIEHVDKFSSARFFGEWASLIPGPRPMLTAPDKPADFLRPPRSWLGRVGWRRAADA